LKVASRITSRHQIIIQEITDKIPNNKTKSPYKKACIYNAAPIAVVAQATELTIGHGLGSTK
jgi:hypothetical protein